MMSTSFLLVCFLAVLVATNQINSAVATSDRDLGSPQQDQDKRQQVQLPYRHPLLDAPLLQNGSGRAVVDSVETGTPELRYAVVHRCSIRGDSSDQLQADEMDSITSGVEVLHRSFFVSTPASTSPLQLPVLDENLQTLLNSLSQQRDGILGACPRQEPLDTSCLRDFRQPSMSFLHVTIALQRPKETLIGHLRSAKADNEILDVDDLHQRAKKYRKRRQRFIQQDVKRVARWIRKLGGSVGYQCQNTRCLSARIPASVLEKLIEKNPSIQRISLVEPLLEEDGRDAFDRAEGMQMNQYIDFGYDGEQTPGTFRDDIWFGIVETNTFDDEHPAWGKEGVNWRRVASRFICQDGPDGCDYIYNFPTPNPPDDEDHATKVLSLVMANTLVNGQDQQVNNAARYNGFARNALGRLFQCSNTAALDEAMDTIRSFLGPFEHVVNMSLGAGIKCNGDETAAITANSMFEDGTLLIKSAGNKSFNPFSPSACKVTSPGGAIGVFTVAGLKGDPLGDGAWYMRGAGIYHHDFADKGSSVGGSELNLACGRGRTIVDIAAHANVAWVPHPVGEYFSLFYFQGTSAATPQVTGAAINFVDYFQDQHFNLEYEPGFLYTNLLLMGDRTSCQGPEQGQLGNCNTIKMDSRFDRRFGAGRAKFRKFDPLGLDSPAHYGTGYIPCLANGEFVALGIPDNGPYVPMEPEVDYIKIVAWWYDRRHELTGTVANVDLRLYHVDESDEDIGTLAVSDDLYDNKERIYSTIVADKRLVLEFSGTDMFPGDDSWIQDGCANPGEVDVYFAYLAEEDQHNDGDGPFWDVQAGVGIEPESSNW